MKVMNAGVDRPLNHLQSRSMNAARCCRNLQSIAPNWPLTARAIFFLIPISILRSSCPRDNGPFVAANETFVIALLGRLQPAIELGKMPRKTQLIATLGRRPIAILQCQEGIVHEPVPRCLASIAIRQPQKAALTQTRIGRVLRRYIGRHHADG